MCVCVVSVIVKRPVLPPSVVDGRSRNPLYHLSYHEQGLSLSIAFTTSLWHSDSWLIHPSATGAALEHDGARSVMVKSFVMSVWICMVDNYVFGGITVAIISWVVDFGGSRLLFVFVCHVKWSRHMHIMWFTGVLLYTVLPGLPSRPTASL